MTQRRILITLVALVLGAGCATRTTVAIDTASDWVRLTAPVEADVATFNNGVWESAGKFRLPAGWYAGPGKRK